MPNGQYCSNQSASRLVATSPNLQDLVILLHAHSTACYPLKTLRVCLVPLWAALNERAYSTARSPKITRSMRPRSSAKRSMPPQSKAHRGAQVEHSGSTRQYCPTGTIGTSIQSARRLNATSPNLQDLVSIRVQRERYRRAHKTPMGFCGGFADAPPARTACCLPLPPTAIGHVMSKR